MALTPSRPESGCVRVIPGSHRKGQLAHFDTMRSRCYRVGRSLPTESAKRMRWTLSSNPAMCHCTTRLPCTGDPSTAFAAGFDIAYKGAGSRQTADAAPPPRNRWFVDSPLEQSGFEPPVPDGDTIFWRPTGTDLPGTQVREQQNLHHATEILIEDKASGTQLIRVLIADGGGGDRRAKHWLTLTYEPPQNDAVAMTMPFLELERAPDTL